MNEQDNREKRNFSAEERKNAYREARRADRETVFSLLYETEYHAEEMPEDVFARAASERDFQVGNSYIHEVYFGVMSHREALDEIIGRHAKGWRTNRLSRVSRAILRLGTYEMAFLPASNVPMRVAINEAIELSKKYDDPKAPAFINGVLNAIKDDLTESGGRLSEPAAPVQSEETPPPDTLSDESGTPADDSVVSPAPDAPAADAPAVNAPAADAPAVNAPESDTGKPAVSGQNHDGE